MFETQTLLSLPNDAPMGKVTAKRAQEAFDAVMSQYRLAGRPEVTSRSYKEGQTGKMEEDARILGMLGYFPQTTSGDGGHINLGRTVTGAVLTGGISLLFGGSRSKGRATVLFVKQAGPSPVENLIAGLRRVEALGDPENAQALRSKLRIGTASDAEKATFDKMKLVMGFKDGEVTKTYRMDKSGRARFHHDMAFVTGLGATSSVLREPGPGTWGKAVLYAVLAFLVVAMLVQQTTLIWTAAGVAGFYGFKKGPDIYTARYVLKEPEKAEVT